MARYKHYTVVDVNNRIVPRRIDDNFGYVSTEPTVVAGSTAYTIALNSRTESCNYVKCSSGTINLVTGGQLGETITIMSSTGGSVIVTLVSGGTASYNIIYAGTSGTYTIDNTRKFVQLIKTSTGADSWTVLNKST